MKVKGLTINVEWGGHYDSKNSMYEGPEEERAIHGLVRGIKR